MKILLALIVMLIFSQLSFTQTDSVYNFMLPAFRIHQNDNGRKVFYEFENKWNLVNISDSILTADPNKYSYEVNIKDVYRISFNQGSNPEKGVIIGGISGFLLGYLVSSSDFDLGGGSNYSFGKGVLGAFAGGLICAIIGGAISSAFSSYENYNFEDIDMNIKKQKMISAFNKNRIKK